MKRRTLLKSAAALLGLVTLAPFRALAAVWNRVAFESPNVEGALQGLGATQVGPSRDIVLIAPDLAENGAIVQIQVESRIPGTEAISVLAEKNPTSLIANFVFSSGAEPYVVTRIKLAETGELKAVVKAGGKYYSVSKKVEVALGGCG
jgi:sulfur-oxidizing protein SoxY